MDIAHLLNPAFVGLPRAPPRAPIIILEDAVVPTVPAIFAGPAISTGPAGLARPITPPLAATLGPLRVPFAPIDPNVYQIFRMTRDDRIRVHALHAAGLSYNAIMDQLPGAIKSQVRYALKQRLTP